MPIPGRKERTLDFNIFYLVVWAPILNSPKVSPPHSPKIQSEAHTRAEVTNETTTLSVLCPLITTESDPEELLPLDPEPDVGAYVSTQTLSLRLKMDGALLLGIPTFLG